MGPPEGEEEEFVTHHCMMITYVSDIQGICTTKSGHYCHISRNTIMGTQQNTFPSNLEIYILCKSQPEARSTIIKFP